MFSPRRSIEKKVDRKAKRDRFRKLSDSRDNNIKLNLLGVPKDQVSVKKTHQESNNEDMFKIYIDTQNKADKKNKPESPKVGKYGNRITEGNSSEGSTGDYNKPRVLGGTDTESSDPTHTRPDSGVCLTLPGEKKRDIKIFRRSSQPNFRDVSSETNLRESMKQYMKPEKQPIQPFQQSKEQTKKHQSGQFSTLDRDDGQRNIDNIRHNGPVGSTTRKQGPKQVGFSDYDAVYGTGSEESFNSGDDMPFGRRPPMVYQVGGTMPGFGFGCIGTKFSPNIDKFDGENRGVTNPPGAYKSMEPFKFHDDQERQPKQLDTTPLPMTEQLSNSLVMDGNFTPQTYKPITEQSSLNDNIKQSPLNVVGERYPKTRHRNVTKPMMVDKEVMTDIPSVTSKGNVSTIGSNQSKPLSVSKIPSKESMDSNRSSDLSKPKMSLVSSIPRPDLGIFRRSKSPKNTVEHGKNPETQKEKPKHESEDDIKDQKKETAVNLAHKVPRKLTPISINDRNYKPIFFPVDTNIDVKNQNRQSQLWFKNVMDNQIDNIASKPGEDEKQTSMDQGITKLGGAQATVKITAKNVSVENSDQISNKTYLSIAKTDDLNTNRPDSLISSLPWSKHLSDNQFENKARRPGKVEKQIPIDPDERKLDVTSQTIDKLRFPQDKVSLGKSDEISYKTYPSTVISNDLNKSKPSTLKTVDTNEEDQVLKLNLNKAGSPMSTTLRNYETPKQPNSDASKKMPMSINTRTDRVPVNDKMTKSVRNPYDEPYFPEPDGYADSTGQNPSFGLPASEDHNMYGVPVEEMIADTAHFSRSNHPSRNTLGPYEEPMKHSKRHDHPEGQPKQLELKPSPLTEQLANLLMMDGNLSPQSHQKLTEQSSLKEELKTLQTSEPTSKTSVQVPNIHLGSVKDINNLSFLNGLQTHDYASTGAIPRTMNPVKSSKGQIKSGQVWPSIGERLSTRGSPFIETIQEECTDDLERPLVGTGNEKIQTKEPNGNRLLCHLPAYDSKGDPNYEFGQGNDNIDKDRRNIIAFPGHLGDSTPFAYSPSGPGVYPLDYAHPNDTQHEQSTSNHDNVTRLTGRKSKANPKRTAPGKARKRSGMPSVYGDDDLGERKEPYNEVFSQGPQQEVIYLGKLPNTTYNVFYSPDEVKVPEDMQSKTVVPIRSEKMISEGPKGILIFVNKKNDHTCPFKTNDYGDKVMDSEENDKKGNKHDNHRASPRGYGGFQPREESIDSRRANDPNNGKKVTVERTPMGKNVTEEFPCGCYRITSFDLADELQTEVFISALCTEGSLCEEAHPELAKNKESAYRPNYKNEPFIAQERSREANNSKDTTKKKRLSHDFGRRFPGIEVIADGVVSKKPIKPRPPAQKMKGANLLASLNIKSNKLNGVCNLYFDDNLKRYIQENLNKILAEDEKTRSKQQSY